MHPAHLDDSYGQLAFSILRIYWDDEKEPSVECPVGDFFGMGWGEYAHLNSLAVCVNPGSAFNSYWQMPFRKNANNDGKLGGCPDEALLSDRL